MIQRPLRTLLWWSNTYLIQSFQSTVRIPGSILHVLELHRSPGTPIIEIKALYPIIRHRSTGAMNEYIT